MQSRAFQSKALRDSGLIRVMEFAVRGIPSVFLPGDAAIDRELAIKVYADELGQMDQLGLSSRSFWSGALGAGMIGLCLWPQTIEFWRQAGGRQVIREPSGVNGPGVLYELVLQYQNDPRLTRLPEFQWFVFQTTLAICKAWAFGDSDQLRFTGWPAIDNVWSLLESVRKSKGQVHGQGLFLGPEDVRAHWQDVPAPIYRHGEGRASAIKLARSVSESADQTGLIQGLGRASSWLQEQRVCSSLSHPGLMAAAMLTVAEHPDAESLWATVFAGDGGRWPFARRRALMDSAQVIQDCVAVANRGRHPTLDALLLVRRVRHIVAQWTRNPQRRWSSLPRVQSPDDTAIAQCDRLGLRHAPDLVFSRLQRPNLLKGQADE